MTIDDVLALSKRKQAIIKARLLDNIKKQGDCWIWQKALSADYGITHIDHKQYKAHRVSYLLHKGAIGDLCVLHTCDVPACINPDHLYLGTRLDNSRDMMVRNRKSTKLTNDIVICIRREYADNRYVHGIQTKLAHKYGVARPTMQHILSGATWTHLLPGE